MWVESFPANEAKIILQMLLNSTINAKNEPKGVWKSCSHEGMKQLSSVISADEEMNRSTTQDMKQL